MNLVTLYGKLKYQQALVEQYADNNGCNIEDVNYYNRLFRLTGKVGNRLLYNIYELKDKNLDLQMKILDLELELHNKE